MCLIFSIPSVRLRNRDGIRQPFQLGMSGYQTLFMKFNPNSNARHRLEQLRALNGSFGRARPRTRESRLRHTDGFPSSAVQCKPRSRPGNLHPDPRHDSSGLMANYWWRIVHVLNSRNNNVGRLQPAAWIDLACLNVSFPHRPLCRTSYLPVAVPGYWPLEAHAPLLTSCLFLSFASVPNVLRVAGHGLNAL